MPVALEAAIAEGFAPTGEIAATATTTKRAARESRPYLVAQRKTREHPVVVNARNYQEAHLLAREDQTIASFGTQISAFELSKTRLKAALAKGAVDLRSRQRDKSRGGQ